MPLQIRRGTDAERQSMTQPLAEGELLYVTDTQKMYVGGRDFGGTPVLGGIQVTGYTNEDAQDTIGTVLSTGPHNGIIFNYDDTAGTISASVDLSSYTGTLKADAFKGSLFADDSSLLVDALSGTFNGNLLGNVTGDLTGDVTGNLTGDVTGDLTGDVTGNLTGTVTGTVIGYVEGDLQGSVFADNSTMIIDGLTGIISNGFITLEENRISYSGGNRLILESDTVNEAIDFKMLGQTGNAPTLTVSASLGTFALPENHLPGDEIGSIQISGYADDQFKQAGGLSAFWSATADMTSATPDSNIIFATRNNVDGFKIFRFDEKGVFNAPVIKATGYATGSLPTGPEEGWMVFDSDTKQFKGWNGTSWVVLG